MGVTENGAIMWVVRVGGDREAQLTPQERERVLPCRRGAGLSRRGVHQGDSLGASWWWRHPGDRGSELPART